MGNQCLEPSATASSMSNGIQPKQHPEFWFDDGSVVLIARNHTAFKVHKSMLAKHSTFFDHMFSLPQPADEDHEAQSYGCAVVHVDDSPTDLEDLLDLLYNCLK